MVSGSRSRRPSGHPHRVDVTDQVGHAGGSGVASFSAYRSLTVPPLDRAGRRRARRPRRFDSTVIGSNGCSPSSDPSMTGDHSSSRPTRLRSRRVLPWPRSPRSTTSWPASRARSSWGMTLPEAVQPGPRVVAGRQRAEQVVADLGAHGPGDVPGGAQLADGGRGGTVTHRITIRRHAAGRSSDFPTLDTRPSDDASTAGTQVLWPGLSGSCKHTGCGSAAVAVQCHGRGAAMSVQGDPDRGVRPGPGAPPWGSASTPPSADPWTSPLWSRPDTVGGYTPPYSPPPVAPPPPPEDPGPPPRRARAVLAAVVAAVLLIGGLALANTLQSPPSTSAALPKPSATPTFPAPRRARPRPALPRPVPPRPAPPHRAPPQRPVGRRARAPPTTSPPQQNLTPQQSAAAAAVSKGLVDVVTTIGYDGRRAPARASS